MTQLWPLGIYFALVLLLVAGMLTVSCLLGQRHRERAVGAPCESGILCLSGSGADAGVACVLGNSALHRHAGRWVRALDWSSGFRATLT